jgi:hypothetical protein
MGAANFNDLINRAKMRLPTGMISRLTPAQRFDLELMKSDNAVAGAPFRPSSVLWEPLSRVFEKRIHVDGLENPENSRINSWFFGQPPGSKKYYQYALWLLYGRVRERDTFGLLDRVTPSGDATHGVTIEIGGRLLSWDYLISVDTAISLLEAEPRLLTDAMIILELGAGWGRLGSILLKINPRLIYVDCDIPVSLIVAQNYLPRTLPTVSAFPYRVTREVAEFTREHFLSKPGLYFCGTQHLPRFAARSVDLFININSFGEMSGEQVGAYMQIAERIVAEAIYILQRDQGDVLTRDDYPFPQGWRLEFNRPVSFAPAFFEAFCRRVGR